MLDYGIVGNCNTCALIGKRGGVHWMCYPDFDSPSVFAKILDKDAGRFEVKPDRACEVEQEYIEHTNILETTFENEDYAFKIIDFFPRYKKLLPNKKNKTFRQNRLVRIIEPLRGTPRLKVIFEPALDYGRGHTAMVKQEESILARNGERDIELFTNVDFDDIMHQEFFEVKHRQYLVFGKPDEPEFFDVKKCLNLLSATKKYWNKWVDSLVLPEEYRERIIRSALVLKLLTYSKTGAIIAAPTTSIPEEVGTERTWDYRYCWVRDATYCVDALKKIGRGFESKKLMEFFIKQALENDYIQIMYGINGETRLKEETLDHLDGFKGSKPVRIGNAAYKQYQHDIYGELIEIMYLYFVYYGYEKKMTRKYWRVLKYLVHQIEFSWEKKDSGLWEFRGNYEHFTFSKYMCYVGMDRAVKIAQHFQKEDLVKEWVDLREAIRASITKKGCNHEKNAFTMSYGREELDAALLLMTYHGFLEDTDPRIINTVKSIYDELTHKGYLVQRYNVDDGFGKSNSAFTICTSWLIQALYTIGEKEKAKNIYEKLMKRGNHLGLFSEDIDIETGKLIGNFPQAYTHIAIINTSILLSEWSSDRKKIDWEEINIPNVL